jgi:hypothetical protein
MGAALDGIESGVTLTFFAEVVDSPRVKTVVSALQDIIVQETTTNTHAPLDHTPLRDGQDAPLVHRGLTLEADGVAALRAQVGNT